MNPEHKKENYKLLVFKLEGHTTWRINNLSGMKSTRGKITEQKLIEIDVITGDVKITNEQTI